MTDGDATAQGRLSWRRVVADDFGLLGRWLADPVVARWWNHETDPAAVARDFGPGTRGEESGEDWLVSLDGEPVGLVQRARIADYPEEHAAFAALTEVPPGAVMLDYLVGPAARRGRGLGTRVVADAVDRTWAQTDAPSVLVAVVAANTASWRTLERVGLRRVAEGPMEPDNPVDDPWHVVYRVDRPA
jgi:aminoglycoside 6'-N-acetyltransferase